MSVVNLVSKELSMVFRMSLQMIYCTCLLKPFVPDAAYDKIEDALSKFSDGPFFLGQFSLVMYLVDIAYAPFVERFQTLLLDVKNYDILKGRPKLALWIEVLPCPS
ncbi:hypothetical protein BHM03_00037702 [Ensete ventricosum]|nr:hypothetical protein BHM03_00037702 [Ensete ventricosum]